jgi:hypothetical protein
MQPVVSFSAIVLQAGGRIASRSSSTAQCSWQAPSSRLTYHVRNILTSPHPSVIAEARVERQQPPDAPPAATELQFGMRWDTVRPESH